MENKFKESNAKFMNIQELVIKARLLIVFRRESGVRSEPFDFAQADMGLKD
jgi:hypothetical protein